jgi:hypothetical protein
LTLAGSGGLGTSGEHEAINTSVNIKKMARRPNFLWCPRMSLWLPDLDDVRSVPRVTVSELSGYVNRKQKRRLTAAITRVGGDIWRIGTSAPPSFGPKGVSWRCERIQSITPQVPRQPSNRSLHPNYCYSRDGALPGDRRADPTTDIAMPHTNAD